MLQLIDNCANRVQRAFLMYPLSLNRCICLSVCLRFLFSSFFFVYLPPPPYSSQCCLSLQKAARWSNSGACSCFCLISPCQFIIRAYKQHPRTHMHACTQRNKARRRLSSGSIAARLIPWLSGRSREIINDVVKVSLVLAERAIERQMRPAQSSR